MVEKSGVEKSGVEKSGVEMSFNPGIILCLFDSRSRNKLPLYHNVLQCYTVNDIPLHPIGNPFKSFIIVIFWQKLFDYICNI